MPDLPAPACHQSPHPAADDQTAALTRSVEALSSAVETLARFLDRAHSAPVTAEGAVTALADVPKFDYLAFEQQFRGSEIDIRQRQLGYMELFAGARTVLDIGCGRGEFLDLLRERGIGAIGVDLDVDMVAYVRKSGHDVVHADVFEYMVTLPDASLDGVFAAQVVEHLAPERILHLLSLIACKLRPGGTMVAETINSRCPVAMNWFYLDPTHVRPVPPELLRFMCQQLEFQVRALRFSSPLDGAAVDAVLEAVGDLPREVDYYQDYAVIAQTGQPQRETAVPAPRRRRGRGDRAG